MRIEFSPSELQHMQIEMIAPQTFNQAYHEERELVWTEAMEKAATQKRSLWNGDVYTFENILHQGDEHVTLQMSSCEFKDVIFKVEKGSPYIIQQYGYPHLVKLVGVICVPLTQDGKYVVGIRADQQFQGGAPVGAIGGLLSRDEMKIETFADIQAFMRKEMNEETSLIFSGHDLKLYRLIFQKNIYHFCFTLKLPIHSDEIRHFQKPGEFSELVALTQLELQECARTIHPLKYLVPYLSSLSS
jgi:hypothetical protein